MAFLELEILDALYGGAAGGGKSDALLMGGVMFWEVPGYAALILRRTLADLKKPGALLDRSREWFGRAGVKAKYSSQEYRWRFASGATLQFGYCEGEKDVEQYRSTEFQFIGIDEATQFTSYQLRYVFSRLRRRRTIPVPLRYRLGSNPGGPSHEFIKRRYIKPGTSGKAFVPAKIKDNPGIDQTEYELSLAELDPLTRAQLLDGDWDAVLGGRFKREWFRSYRWRGDYCVLITLAGEKAFLPKQCLRFITVDPAASTSTAADWTVISAWCVSPWGDLVWLGCNRLKREIPDIVPEIGKAVRRWRPDFVGIEAIASNRAVYQIACRSTDPVIPARPLDKGDRDKLIHATQGITLAAAGRVYLPLPEADPSFPVEDVMAELVQFTGDDKKDAHDDVVDTLSYAAEAMIDLHTGPTTKGDLPRIIGG